jgi:CheY-like chemotaxis protein
MLMTVVLVVEDEACIRDTAVLLLHDWGYHTLSACDVDEALVVLRSSEPIDALFTDIVLKTAVQGGYELAQEAIALRPTLRVLYTTANAVSDTMTALFVAGASHLRKPYSPAQLQSSLEGMLA